MRLRRWQRKALKSAFDKYKRNERHFLCLATPGAGKTYWASALAKRLLDTEAIDLVLCFAPSIMVAAGFKETLSETLKKRVDGSLGAAGRVLTYQSMLNQNESFWKLFEEFRVFVIFDEIHHCAGSDFENANAWGLSLIHI